MSQRSWLQVTWVHVKKKQEQIGAASMLTLRNFQLQLVCQSVLWKEPDIFSLRTATISRLH